MVRGKIGRRRQFPQRRGMIKLAAPMCVGAAVHPFLVTHRPCCFFMEAGSRARSQIS